MRRPEPLPGPLQGRSFTLWQAEVLGVSRGRLNGADLHTPSRGIRVPWGIQQDLTERIRPILESTPDGAASHTTAALLWNMPVPAWACGLFTVHVTRAAACNPAHRAGVTGHHCRFEPGEVRILRGLPVTSPLRTWLDLAPLIDLDDLVAAGDFLVCEHHRSFGPPRWPLVSLPELQSAARSGFRRRGIVAARYAAALVEVGADSPPETFLRLELVRNGVNGIVLNHVVRHADRDVAWPDMAIPEWKVSIEYDGAHHRSVEQKQIDDARDHVLAQLGWRQVRISAGLVREGGYLAAVVRVKEALKAQGWVG